MINIVHPHDIRNQSTNELMSLPTLDFALLMTQQKQHELW